MASSLPSSDELKLQFTYDPETGDLFKIPFVDAMGRYQTRYSKGPIRNVLTNHGGKSYYRTSLTSQRKDVLVHRVIFKMVYGWEPEEVDHINGDGCDNRLVNLRACDHVTNHQNRRLSSSNTSGAMGVSRTRGKKRWRARIRYQGKDINLGEFANMVDAIQARRDAELEFGFHDNHGTVRPL